MKIKWYWWALGSVGVLALISQGNRIRVTQNLSEVKLGENFSLDEFVRTSTGLDNIPNEEQIANLQAVVKNILQPLRTRLGRPITITSGFRSEAVNKEVGSSSSSQHPKGEAVDFKIAGMTNQQIIDEIRAMRLPYDQLIDEDKNGNRWVHVSHKRNSSQRLQWMTARWNGTSYNYQTIQQGKIV